MNLDGKKLAAEILARANARAKQLHAAPKILAIAASETPATKSYLAIKKKRAEDAGCVLEVAAFPESVSGETLRLAIATAEVDAIIVQLPLPAHIDAEEVCNAIPLEKDADILSNAAYGRFEHGEAGALLPPVAAAIKHILESSGVVVRGKRAAVVGAGKLVGKPAATLLAQLGAEVQVFGRDDTLAELESFDVVVCGAGVPGLIKPEMLREGAVLIDAATSESNGLIAGDADPACAAKCALFTPVPGGVGPVAVATLFENAVILAERSIA